MKGQSGKITFLSLIVFVILVLGAFMAFKYISGSLTKKQIKIEVFDTLGSTRGGDMGNAAVSELIEGILRKKGVEVLEVNAEVDAAKAMIHYSFKYKLVINYLLFEHVETVEVVDQIENYG
jgi:hypothetical protein